MPPFPIVQPPSARPLRLAVALPVVCVVALAGCSRPAAPAAETSPVTRSTAAAEAATVTPRLVISHDQGLQVLDATSLEPVADLDLPGFNRLNAAGDGRHLLVSTAGEFRVLDAGTWAEPHGDHDHYYTTAPALTETAFPATKPGHVVAHDGRTALFDDGTGTILVQDSAAIAAGAVGAREYTTPAAHHGVAVELADGDLVVSEGDEQARTGIRVLDPAGTEIAAATDCPGVHGEAMAAGEAVVIGCEDGAVVYRRGQITKVDSPDPYGRIGNQAGSDASPIVLGDYKTDPDAELERPTRVSLIDTRSARLKLVDLPSSYTFRSLGRGAAGEGLVLGTDGALHVIDPVKGKLTRSIPVVDPWTEPTEWQSPRPTLRVVGESAYVTDPATRTLRAVDYATGKVYRTAELTVTPNELEVASGEAAPSADEHGADEHGADEHEADGHEHASPTPR